MKHKMNVWIIITITISRRIAILRLLGVLTLWCVVLSIFAVQAVQLQVNLGPAWCVLSSCETRIVAEHFCPNCWSSRWEAVWCKPWQIRVSLLPLHPPSNDLPSATDQNQNNPIRNQNINLLAKFANANGATWWLKSIQVVLLCDQ